MVPRAPPPARAGAQRTGQKPDRLPAPGSAPGSRPRARLSTAVELSADRGWALKDGLARATGRDVQLETTVDPALVGGAVARIGSTVYDGSITTQLQRLKQSLIESAQ